jgi:hypothetical protein
MNGATVAGGVVAGTEASVADLVETADKDGADRVQRPEWKPSWPGERQKLGREGRRNDLPNDVCKPAWQTVSKRPSNRGAEQGAERHVEIGAGGGTGAGAGDGVDGRSWGN